MAKTYEYRLDACGEATFYATLEAAKVAAGPVHEWESEGDSWCAYDENQGMIAVIYLVSEDET